MIISLGVLFSPATATVSVETAFGAARFVLSSLQEINDSGIYRESLRLTKSIRHARLVKSLFHTCILLDVELSSSNFASGNETELFEMIVMGHTPEDLDDGDNALRPKSEDPSKLLSYVGYAIDRFPKMKGQAIEDALQRKVASTVLRNGKIRKEIFSLD